MRRLGAAIAVTLAVWLVAASGQQPAPSAYVPGDLIVKFRPAASQARRNGVLSARGARVIRTFGAFDLQHVALPQGQSVEDAIAALQANPDVEFAQPNYIRHSTQSAPPNDPLWLNGTLWGLLKIQAQNAWSSYTSGDGTVVVADIDTGINYNHPDLAANIWTNPLEIPGNGLDDDGDGYIDDVHGINVLTGSGDPMDDNGHGTHTAGTMAAVGNNGVGVAGVNWNAKIIACKFLNSAGSGSDSGAIACFNYIVVLKQRGVNIRVTNNSWGANRSGSIDQALKTAIDAAGSAGILNAFAAGNNHTNNDTTPFDPASIPSSSIIAVAASDQSDNRASFSNFGGSSVHLAAPGVSITSTYGSGYAALDGTSMATPHVAGAAAIIAFLNPALAPAAIKTLLMNNVDVFSQWAGAVASGGRLNLFKATTAVVSTTPPTVSLTSPSGGTNFVPPATVTLTANASKPGGSVSSVKFYASGALLGTSTVSPYSVSWSGMASGAYNLTAVATDNLGLTATSTGAAITVNTKPTVSLTSPAAGVAGTAPATVTVSANAADSDGTIASVAFFANGSPIGTDATSPYSIIWTGVAAGNYSLTAVATDNLGATTTSSVVSVTVNPVVLQTSQTLLTTQVPDSQNVNDGTAYELGLGLISDVDGQLTALRFWKGTSEVGPHVGHIWSGSGQLLATVTFTNETASGWQQQALTTPLTVTANTAYVASVTTGATNFFVAAWSAFSSPVVNGHLRTVAGNAARYGAAGAFPSGATGNDYFRDVVFVPASGPSDTTPPTVSITQPTGGSTVSGTVTIAATASDDVGVAGVQFQVDGVNVGSEVASAPYTIGWDSTTKANGSHALTAIARDAAGHTTPASVTVTVSNAGGPVSQTLLTTQVPDSQNVNDGTAYELGLGLMSDVDGQLTALRFWKGTSEVGPHVGHIWSGSGQLLATVTFTNETASGWQQQALTTPLAVTANTAYVVSVTTGATSFFVSAWGAFSSPVVNAHLRTVAGNAGRYGAAGAFPSGATGNDYFRDVVFVPASGPSDTTPPTVSITQPTGGSTVSGTVTIAATASDDVGVAGVQFQVDGVNVGSEVASAPYTIGWDSTTKANGSHALTAIARDAAGHTTPASVTVTVSNAGGPVSQTLLTTQVPDSQNVNDGTAYELGLGLMSDVDGQLTALRFWKGTSEVGPHVGHIWSGSGQLLATVTFTNETASGWQQQALTTPLTVTANTAYVASVTTGATNFFVAAWSAFSSPVVNGHLRTVAGNAARYGAAGAFPSGATGNDYFRDVVFVPASGPSDTTPPTVSITQPTGGSTVSGTVTIAATASDDVGVAGVQFQVDGVNVGSEVASAPYTIGWDSTTKANGSHTLTAIARDAAGHTTPASVTVTVSNAGGPVSQTLLTTQVPDSQNVNDGTAYELGLGLMSDVDGQLTALRFWKGTSEVGPHVGHIWSGSGQLLATVTFTNETASGWQQQALTTPLAVTANTAYVVSVTTGATSFFVSAWGAFSSPVVNAHLRTVAGNAGRYGAAGAFPTGATGNDYFRDVVFVAGGGSGPALAPAPVQASNLTVRMDFVGHVPTNVSNHNLTSPAVAGSQLLLIDQSGYVYRWDGSLHNLLGPADFPSGIFPPGGESVLNVAANVAATTVFVMFSTFTAPTGIPVSISPRPFDSWQVLYKYDFNGTALSNPRAIRAFQVRSDGHTGGGLVVLGDGTVLCAIGDNGDAGEDGRSYAQDASNHLAKILRVNPADASATVVALGVRNVQRLAIDPNGGDPRLTFADLGGYLAEEINSIRLADLLDGTTHNFGWGRSSVDNKAREGTFYIDANGSAVGAAPTPESGFLQPVAQWGREGAPLIAASGPAISTLSLSTITALFGDLPTGAVWAVTGPPSVTGQPVFHVALVDGTLQPVTLMALAGGNRPDPRFFTFPDGTAGVILERTGDFYRLTQVTAAPAATGGSDPRR